MKDLSKTGIAIQFLLVVGVLIVIVGFALLYHDYQSSAASHREVMRARGQTLLDSLTAGISAQGRMGRYQPERLSAIFEGLVYTPDILGIVLSTQEGVVISSGGEAPNPMEAVPESPRWQENRLTMVCEPLLLGQGPGRGSGFGVNRGRRPGWRGRPENDNEWKPFPRGPYFLVATLDTTAMRDKIHKEQIRFAVSTGVMLIAVLLGALFLLAWIRQRNLQVALLIAQERTTQQEHLTQLGAGFAHETKNPLGIVRGQAQLIADSSDSQDNTVRAAMIVDEIDRTVRQVNSF
ncbi:MAG: hypothetical protein KAH38_12855, partial [Candidatus Hydrogenedentes bacterium]|nr:hypothetical protein [Candidatus Hydrogenedentota bacterium]